jgi:hypothetical protein
MVLPSLADGALKGKQCLNYTVHQYYQKCVSVTSTCSSIFDSVVISTFQITFRAKIHVNDVFLFLKNYC